MPLISSGLMGAGAMADAFSSALNAYREQKRYNKEQDFKNKNFDLQQEREDRIADDADFNQAMTAKQHGLVPLTEQDKAQGLLEKSPDFVGPAQPQNPYASINYKQDPGDLRKKELETRNIQNDLDEYDVHSSITQAKVAQATTLSNALKQSPVFKSNPGLLNQLDASIKGGTAKDIDAVINSPAMKMTLGLIENTAKVNAMTPAPGTFSAKNLTPAQKSADSAFGKEYSDYVGGGGYAGVQEGLNKLEEIRDNLKTNPGLTGGLLSHAPDSIRSVADPDSLAAQQEVETVIQKTLKQIYGARVTQFEAKALLGRAYDPRLPAKENIKKLDSTIEEMRNKAEAKDAAVREFEDKGTISQLKASSKNGGGLIKQEASKKVRVSDGKETYMIDPSDMEDAKKDGFEVVR